MTAVDVLQLHLTDVRFPPGHPQAGETGAVLGYAIRHANGVALFDTGVGTGSAEIDEWFEPRHRPLLDLLARRSIAPDDIVAVANSHLHFDHCGNNRLFPGASWYAQRGEVEAVLEPGYTIREWADVPGKRYEILEGDAEILPGVTLLATPGHTRGHQSAVIRGADGVDLFAGQAVYTAAEWEGDTDPRGSGLESAWNADAYLSSVERLRAVGADRVFFAHDERVIGR
jgi:N-acyl homoserine lactone hydrolase